MRSATLAGGLLVALLAASAVQADLMKMIASSDFCFAYGATEGAGNPWTTTENTATNSPTTQGDFSMSAAPSSTGPWSGRGVIFTNRTMGQGDGTTGRSAWAGDFAALPITGSYNGLAPADVDPTNPDYKLNLEITGISIYGHHYTTGSSASSSMAWSEVTVSHESTMSPSVSLPTSDNTSKDRWNDPAYYAKVAWDPGDWFAPLASLNSSSVRSFDILGGGPNDYRLLDGLEISGRVILSYNAVPEPSMLAIMAVAFVGLLAYAWRKQR